MPPDTYILHLDESIKDPYIGVGGLICKQDDIADLEERWGDVKERMGLSRTDELKWSLGQNHPSRLAVQGTPWDLQSARAPAMVEAIAAMPVTALCDVLVDRRNLPGRGQLDFYRHALNWLLGRFAMFLQRVRGASSDGPHFVIVDQPPIPQDVAPGSSLRDSPSYGWIGRRHRIAFDVYTDAYEVGFSTYANPPPPLRALGLYPSLVVSHADVNPLLQMADVVVGATTQCISENLTNYLVTNPVPVGRPLIPGIVMRPQRGDTCMPTLWTKFRGYDEGRVIPYGLTVFPPDTTEGWAELKAKMEAWG